MIDNNNIERQRRIIRGLEKRIAILRDALSKYANPDEWEEGSRGFSDLFLGCNNGVDLANTALDDDLELERRLL